MHLKLSLLLFGFLLFSSSYGQSQPGVIRDTASAIKYLKDWENDLFDEGFSLQKDSVHVSDETKRLFLDESYRKSTYPASYNWTQAIQILKSMELKKAFWHLQNLYRTDKQHKELILQTFVLYDSLVDMERILLNSFYTYAFADPEVCVVSEGKPMITHPDVLESKFANVKEIIGIVKLNRKPEVGVRPAKK